MSPLSVVPVLFSGGTIMISVLSRVSNQVFRVPESTISVLSFSVLISTGVTTEQSSSVDDINITISSCCVPLYVYVLSIVHHESVIVTDSIPELFSAIFVIEYGNLIFSCDAITVESGKIYVLLLASNI